MTLARFTPSVLDGETLERLFVHRHHLLDDVMQRVRDGGAGSDRRHRLFVGPRGAGKTHLISLVNHRVRQARADGLAVGLSWLMEDPWEVETYEDLLDQVLEHLEGDPPTRPGERGVLEAAANGPIVVLIENLDQVLTAIGAEGQRRLRALLENKRPMLIVATSTRLSDDLLSQAEPFYGFFDTTHLEPFTIEQAADMLWHVAEHNGDDGLRVLLESEHATPRLATIAHLAGGQPRVWALLGTGLTDSGIDDMVDMLLARFDDLTPYYQEQLARLSPSERKAVRRLADADRPLTVRDLAGLAKTDQRSMSKTVSDLRKRGWVRKHDSILTKNLDARLSYYELAEPLARIAFQMKAARGEPVRLLVEFLSVWFDKDELQPRDLPGAFDARGYRQAALRMQSTRLSIVRALAKSDLGFGRSADCLPILESLDESLAEFQKTGATTSLLQEPSPVLRVIENRLSSSTAGEVRVDVALIALSAGGRLSWRVRLDDVIENAESFLVTTRALLLLALVERGGETWEMVVAQLARMIDSLTEADRDEFLRFLDETFKAVEIRMAAQTTLAITSMSGLTRVNDIRQVELVYHKALALAALDQVEDAVEAIRAARREFATHAAAPHESFRCAFWVAGVYYMVDWHQDAVAECDSMLRLLYAQGFRKHDAVALTVRYMRARSLGYFDPEQAQLALSEIVGEREISTDLQRMALGMRQTIANRIRTTSTDAAP